MSVRRILLFVLLGLIGLGVLAGLAAVLVPSGWVPDEVILTIVIVGVYTLGALVAVTAARSMRRLLAVCMWVAGLSCAGFLAGIWLEGSIGWTAQEWIFRISGCLVFASLAMLHRMVIGPLRFRAGPARLNLRVALIAVPVLAGLLTLILLWDDWNDYDELIMRLIGVAGIVAAGSSVVAGVVWFFERRPEHDEPGMIGQGVAVEMVCPRCQAVIRGRSNRECRCGSCRLKVRIEVEEPRCDCGYLLYQLAGDTCPECGKAVAPEDRWSVDAVK